MKTNAARLLDSLGIPYELRDYAVGPEHLDAVAVAEKVGLPPSQVFKTLVARGDQTGVLLAVIPGNTELDLKALARLSGNRRVELVPLKEVQPLTGYIRGGVTALGLKRNYPVFVDETIELFDRIAVSAGARGTQVLLAPADYLKAVGPNLGPLSKYWAPARASNLRQVAAKRCHALLVTGEQQAIPPAGLPCAVESVVDEFYNTNTIWDRQ